MRAEPFPPSLGTRPPNLHAASRDRRRHRRRWSKIVQLIPGRTVASVRNRWQRLEKGRKMREEGKESKNRCHACGQPKRGHVCYAKLGQSSVADQLPASAHETAARAAPVPPRLRNTRSTNTVDLLAGLLQGDSNAPAPLQPVRLDSLAATFGFNPDAPNGAPSAAGAAAGPSGSGAVGPPSLAVRVASLDRANDSFFEMLSATSKFSEEWRAMFEDWSGSGGGQSESAAAALAVADADANAPPVLRAVASGGACPPRLTRSVTSYIRELTDAGLQSKGMLDRPSAVPATLKPAAGLVKQPSPMLPPLVPTLSGGLRPATGGLRPATGGLKRSAGLAGLGDADGLPRQLKPAAGFAPPPPGLAAQPSPLSRLRSS